MGWRRPDRDYRSERGKYEVSAKHEISLIVLSWTMALENDACTITVLPRTCKTGPTKIHPH
jgi:hypothetical protein